MHSSIWNIYEIFFGYLEILNNATYFHRIACNIDHLPFCVIQIVYGAPIRGKLLSIFLFSLIC